jgi:hypothetical protein
MKYYLAKRAEILGPLSLKDVETMQKNGELDRFSFLWDPKKKLWAAIDQAPDMNPEQELASLEKSSPDQKVYCMIHDQIVRGQMQARSSFGCQFVSDEDWMSPPVAPRSLVSLILCEAKGIPQELPMRVGSVERTPQGWVLHLRKDELRRFG